MKAFFFFLPRAYTVNILMGKLTPPPDPDVPSEGIAEFGIRHRTIREHVWNSLIRQLLLKDILKKRFIEKKNTVVLKFTKKEEDFFFSGKKESPAP